MTLKIFTCAALITTLGFTFPVTARENPVSNRNTTKSMRLAQYSGSHDRIIETNGSTIYHDNGKTALGSGFGAPVYHDNGQQAWGGVFGTPIYYANGRMAWNGIPGTPCYLPDGRVRTNQCYGIADMPIGSGMYLSVNLVEILLKVPELGTLRLGRSLSAL